MSAPDRVCRCGLIESTEAWGWACPSCSGKDRAQCPRATQAPATRATRDHSVLTPKEAPMAIEIPGPLDHTLRQLAAARRYACDGSRWTHKDHPLVVYRVATHAVMQIDGPADMTVCVLYDAQTSVAGEPLGMDAPRLTWCRPLAEFVERFAPVTDGR